MCVAGDGATQGNAPQAGIAIEKRGTNPVFPRVSVAVLECHPAKNGLPFLGQLLSSCKEMLLENYFLGEIGFVPGYKGLQPQVEVQNI